MQKHDFTFKDLCSYVLYWAMEEGQTKTIGLYESDLLDIFDCKRVSHVLCKIIQEGRIGIISSDNSIKMCSFVDNIKFSTMKETVLI